MEFCTAVTCMDGRIQLPVIFFLQKRFDVEFVDVVSEAGPNKILAENENQQAVESIGKRVAVSVDSHYSKGIAVVGHYDCAGNPVDESEQREQTITAVRLMRTLFASVPVIGLWVDQDWLVSELEID